MYLCEYTNFYFPQFSVFFIHVFGEGVGVGSGCVWRVESGEAWERG